MNFAYNPGRHCVSTCPNGTLIEDEHCVARCSPGNYRFAQTDNKRCVPCPESKCPRVCQLDEPLNADNIRTLVNCSEIEGNIEILGYAFHEHLPPGVSSIGPIAGSRPRLMPPLNASQLEVLRSVRIVTGFVVVDGSKTRSRLKPNSLGFLENLEVIEGRRLYYEASANFVYCAICGAVEVRSLRDWQSRSEMAWSSFAAPNRHWTCFDATKRTPLLQLYRAI